MWHWIFAINVPICIVGLIGIMFPVALAAGMGAVEGDELGLGSGILTMSRQVGAAIGVAVVASVFTATLTTKAKHDRVQVMTIARQADYPPAAAKELVRRISFDPRAGARRRVVPRTPVERAAVGIVRRSAANSFGVAFRVAALGVLLAAPLVLLMRRPPDT